VAVSGQRNSVEKVRQSMWRETGSRRARRPVRVVGALPRESLPASGLKKKIAIVSHVVYDRHRHFARAIKAGSERYQFHRELSVAPNAIDRVNRATSPSAASRKADTPLETL